MFIIIIQLSNDLGECFSCLKLTAVNKYYKSSIGRSIILHYADKKQDLQHNRPSGPNFKKSKKICLAWKFFLDKNRITNKISICCILLVTGIQLLFAHPENHVEIWLVVFLWHNDAYHHSPPQPSQRINIWSS